MNAPGDSEANSNSLNQANDQPLSDSLGNKHRRFKRPAPAPATPADIPNYEPLIHHSSRAVQRFLDKDSTQKGKIEDAKMNFYVTYFLKKPERLSSIGLVIPKGQRPDDIIRAYVTYGFMALPETQRNNRRKKSSATSTLAKATTAWHQHLKRSGLINHRQIAVFIPEELHSRIKEAYLNRLKDLPMGESITVDRVVAELLDRGLNRSPLQPPLKQDSGNPEGQQPGSP